MRLVFLLLLLGCNTFHLPPSPRHPAPPAIAPPAGAEMTRDRAIDYFWLKWHNRCVRCRRRIQRVGRVADPHAHCVECREVCKLKMRERKNGIHRE